MSLKKNYQIGNSRNLKKKCTNNCEIKLSRFQNRYIMEHKSETFKKMCLYFVKFYGDDWKVFLNLDDATCYAEGRVILSQVCEANLESLKNQPIYVTYTENEHGNRIFRSVSTYKRDAEKKFESDKEIYHKDPNVLIYEMGEYKFRITHEYNFRIVV